MKYYFPKADDYESQLSIKLGAPQPPKIGDPPIFFLAFASGLILILATTLIVDRLGTAMYRKGFAKPFFIRGRRVHHDCIYFIVPTSYVLLGALFLLGYVQIIWGTLWLKLAFTGVILAGSIAADFLGDMLWPRIRTNAILHHEWIYTIIPAFILTYVVNVII